MLDRDNAEESFIRGSNTITGHTSNRTEVRGMLPLNCIRPLLRYFDAVDRAATAGLLNKRPHLETTTTQLLCALLDEEEQTQFNVEYPLTDLLRELSTLNGSLTA